MENKILIFSGTSDGREIAELISNHHIYTTVCVATDYGKDMMQETPYLQVNTGRMNVKEMECFMQDNSFCGVIDATHPFAIEVSKNIKLACEDSSIPYFRYSREIGQDVDNSEQVHFVNNSTEAAELLETIPGKVLLTTGSKELHVFTSKLSDCSRIIARVLPSLESIQLCLDAGLEYKQIVAMHGPFSESMNLALLEQYQSKIMVTKETGVIGGYPEKMSAARQAGCQVIVIRNPEIMKQYNRSEILRAVEELTKVTIAESAAKEIQVVGLGMGQECNLTIEARNALQDADIIFGAARLLETLQGFAVPKEPLYQKDAILAYLKNHTQYRHPVIVMSGDVGFYSGGASFQDDEEFRYQLISGVSSLTYFCAKLQIPWQDVHITSIHGRQANIIGKLLQYDKVFTLLSDLSDVIQIYNKLSYYDMTDCKVYLGYHLSYEDEKILELQRIEQLDTFPQKGLYVCLLVRTSHNNPILFPAISDDAFLRGKVPMTKEEIRDLSLAKLHLTKNAILYDIGAGTGSVSIATARMDESIKVYAIEKNPEAIDLLEANKKSFCADNMTIIPGTAPQALTDLPTPTHAFIGGSGGNLLEIIQLLWTKNPHIRIVINTVTMETQAEVLTLLQQIPHQPEEIIQINTSTTKTLGKYHLFQANNPVTIISFTCKETI